VTTPAKIGVMAGRRTNLALLWATLLAALTGVGAFIVGTPPGRWMVVAHGVVALAIVVLTPWKAVIAARGLRRHPGRALSIALAAAIPGALVSGVLLVTGVVGSLGPFTTMQVHVALGLLAVGLTLVHALQRPVHHRPTDFARRSLIRAGGVLAGAGGIWLVGEAVLDLVGARGGDRRFTGSHEIVDPSDVPATQWLNDRVQHLDADRHEVVVLGAPHSVSDIVMGGDEIVATLDCTGGWFTTQVFAGTRLARLLADASGTSILVRSVTGYWRRFPIEHADRLLLATHMAGEPLRDGNGGPLRLVAPGRRGYWWVKWVDRIEVDDRPPWWQPPLPLA